METVSGDELKTDEQLDNKARSDLEFKKSRDQLSKDARKRCNEDPDKEPRIIPHPDFGVPVTRTEASLTLKLAKKKSKSKRSEKIKNGLYEVLVPGSSVIKSNELTSIKREPGTREVTVRISDLPNSAKKLKDRPISNVIPNEDQNHQRGK